MPHKQGFSILEMVVVTGILMLIMTTTLVSFPNFRGRISLEKEAAKLARIARQAQSYALSVREFKKTGITFNDNPFCDLILVPSKFPPYGVGIANAQQSAPDLRNSKAFLVFGDINCTKKYEVDFLYGDERSGDLILLEGGAYIKTINGCNDTQPCVANTKMDIVYQRPDPSTTIISSLGSYDRVEIVLNSADDKFSKTVILRTTGQVSIR